MAIDQKTQDALLRAVPMLRKFAVSLCRSADRADDLVQETMLRAITGVANLAPNSNLDAWLVTILRNCFFSDCRARSRTVEDVDGRHAETLVAVPDQVGWCVGKDLHEALEKLPPRQRQVLTLIGGSGMSYEEAATICDCEVGTVKSRVHRARIQLASLLSGETRRRTARPASQASPASRAA
jgi:RNA polymerase sigma-70 factor (ECF subfamily)